SVPPDSSVASAWALHSVAIRHGGPAHFTFVWPEQVVSKHRFSLVTRDAEAAEVAYGHASTHGDEWEASLPVHDLDPGSYLGVLTELGRTRELGVIYVRDAEPPPQRPAKGGSK